MVLRAARNTMLLTLFLTTAACAPKALILEPGPLPLVPQPADRSEGVLWVSQTRDVRPEGQAGPKVGVLYSRFEKTPQVAYLEPKPEIYVKDQLARYLFNVGLEASQDAARGFAAVELEDFSLSEVPGSVWDEVKLRVAYTVRIYERSGREIANVRLEGTQQLKIPMDVERQIEAAFRDAVTDTFQSLSRSEAFKAALVELRR